MKKKILGRGNALNVGASYVLLFGRKDKAILPELEMGDTIAWRIMTLFYVVCVVIGSK